MSGDLTPATKSGTSFSNTGPWAPQVPFLLKGFGQAGDTFLDSNIPDYMSSAVNNLWNSSNNPILTPNTDAASAAVQKTLSGDYLSGGAGAKAALDAASRAITPQIASQFASGGRYGSGLSKSAETTALGDVYANQFNNERNRQMEAAGIAPNLDMTPFNMKQQQLSNMMTAGGARQNAILNFLRAIGGNYGGTASGNANQTSMPAQYNNPFQEGLGSALMLANL